LRPSSISCCMTQRRSDSGATPRFGHLPERLAAHAEPHPLLAELRREGFPFAMSTPFRTPLGAFSGVSTKAGQLQATGSASFGPPSWLIQPACSGHRSASFGPPSRDLRSTLARASVHPRASLGPPSREPRSTVARPSVHRRASFGPPSRELRSTVVAHPTRVLGPPLRELRSTLGWLTRESALGKAVCPLAHGSLRSVLARRGVGLVLAPPRP
jgi:hypothetical protein